MGWIATEIGGRVNNSQIHKITAHRRSDIQDLPIDPNKITWGSECIVMSDASRWILDEDYLWKEFTPAGATTGRMGYTDYQTKAEVDGFYTYKYHSWSGGAYENTEIVDRLLYDIQMKTNTTINREDFILRSVQIWTVNEGDEFLINGKLFTTSIDKKTGLGYKYNKPASIYMTAKNIITISPVNAVPDMLIDIMYL